MFEPVMPYNSRHTMSRNRRYYRNRNVAEELVVGLIKIPFLIGMTVGDAMAKLMGKSKKGAFTLLPKSKDAATFADIPAATTRESVSQHGQNREMDNGDRYTLKKSLLTDTEKEFLRILKEVVGDSFYIESQVPLSGIIKPVDSRGNFTNYRDFNQIRAKSIDFVLYDKEYQAHLAIELDDRSHLRWDRIKRDQFLDNVMKSVGLRIIHVPVSYKYDIAGLRSQIFQVT